MADLGLPSLKQKRLSSNREIKFSSIPMVLQKLNLKQKENSTVKSDSNKFLRRIAICLQTNSAERFERICLIFVGPISRKMTLQLLLLKLVHLEIDRGKHGSEKQPDN